MIYVSVCFCLCVCVSLSLSVSVCARLPTHQSLSAPCVFAEDAIVLKQMQYTGMLQTIKMRREGFSVRMTFEELISRSV